MYHCSKSLLTIFATTLLVFAGARENMGIYGGTVFDYAFDEVHGKLFASIAGPLSSFTSDDSGATW